MNILVSPFFGGGLELSEAQEAKAIELGLVMDPTDPDPYADLEAARSHPEITSLPLVEEQALVEVPDGCFWRVIEYDGMESVLWSMAPMEWALTVARFKKEG